MAVLVTMIGDNTGSVSVQTVAAGSEHTLALRFFLRIHHGRRWWSCDRAGQRRLRVHAQLREDRTENKRPFG